MNSNILSPKVIQYYSGDTLIKESKIIRSKGLSNEFLGMMLGNFHKEDDNSWIQKVEFNSESQDEVESLHEIMMYQLGDANQLNDYESSALIDTNEVVILELPEECDSLIILPNELKIDIQLGEMTTQVRKLVALAIGPNKVSQLSVKIHESSILPHSELVNKVLTIHQFEYLMSLPEIDGMKSTKANVILGDRLESVLNEFV